jgi:molybdopterin-guanine dinucleotide biosynthesis protein A
MLAPHCSGVVLAGGESARFGGAPKGLAVVGGRRVVDRVLDALRVSADECLLITNDSAIRAALPGVLIQADDRPERGSLVGLESALRHSRDGALVCAWDMPFVSPGLFAAMRERGERGALPVIPIGPRGPEPLCAYYPRAALETVERQLEAGELRLSAFITALPASILLETREVAVFGPPSRLFANLNTPEDLARARLLARDEADAPLAELSPIPYPESR